MLKNYPKIALRNLLKHKAYSFINIAGLALGMACCMALILFIQHKFSYDRHHRHAERIYRMHTRSVIFGREILWTYTQAAFARTLQQDYPEVLYASRFGREQNVDLRLHASTAKETNFYWADQEILDIFTFEILRGNKAELLQHPNSVIITEEIAQKYFREVNHHAPYEFRFLDEVLAEYYHSEKALSAIINSFTLLAIVIACLGLLGLISFTAEQKTKEIGIRKVLGASVPNLVLLLSKEFALLVMVANLMAWPLAGYAMQRWLEGFAYRIDLNWWLFALAGGSALLVALLTVSAQAIKAALANPVNSLRYE